MTWVTRDVGSFLYTAAVALAATLRKNAGTEVRVIPVGTGVGNIATLKGGTADIAFNVYENYSALMGEDEFAAFEWGPQKVLTVLNNQTTGTISTLADSGIRQVSDIKGKRVGYVAGDPTITLKAHAITAFAGLKDNEVTYVSFPSSGAEKRGLIEGKTDYSVAIAPPAAEAYTIESSPHGLRWIPMPWSDKAGWQRANEWFPLGTGYIQPGAGVKPTDKIEGYAHPGGELGMYEGRLSDEVVYALVKTIDQSFNDFKDMADGMWRYEFKLAITPAYNAPMHPATIRYAKEKGLWTPEYEAANNALIAKAAKAQKAWDTVIAEASAKQMKASDFKKYWLQRKSELVK